MAGRPVATASPPPPPRAAVSVGARSLSRPLLSLPSRSSPVSRSRSADSVGQAERRRRPDHDRRRRGDLRLCRPFPRARGRERTPRGNLHPRGFDQRHRLGGAVRERELQLPATGSRRSGSGSPGWASTSGSSRVTGSTRRSGRRPTTRARRGRAAARTSTSTGTPASGCSSPSGRSRRRHRRAGSRRRDVAHVRRHEVLPKVPLDAVKYLDPTPTEQLTLQTSTSYYPTAPRFVVIAVPAP